MDFTIDERRNHEFIKQQSKNAGAGERLFGKTIFHGFAAALFLSSFLFWGAGIEPRLVDYKEEVAVIPNLPPAWEGKRIALIADLHVGMWLGLRRQRVDESEVRAAIRSAGFAAIEEIEAVVLETDGTFSVVKKSADGSRSALQEVTDE